MADTAPIRPDERFDETRVATYLRAHLSALVGDHDIVFDQFPGGAANLTYRAVAGPTELVLRRAPLGEVAKGGHDMAREYRVLSRLWRAVPAAPRAYAFCEDPAQWAERLFGFLGLDFNDSFLRFHPRFPNVYGNQTACDYITYMLEERYPKRNWSGLPEKLKHILEVEGEDYLDTTLKEKLPGVYLAGHTSITFTITMPGKIVDSNATSVEGNTAIWKYDMMLASFNHPVELHVTSEISE